jgi:hypothetical protein
MKRIAIVGSGAVLALALVWGISLSAGVQRAAASPVIEVYKTPTCGCCSLWLDHLRQHGFEVKSTDLDDLSPLKARHGVPQTMQSCHTAVVDGYVVEGHVPATDIQRLLKERPSVAGLAVPGMPIGSPGMEVGSRVQPYDVIAFDKQGSGRVFASYR